ncbi:MAG TPA: alkaline phosphatase family protein, partial [Candidatus Acidoferrales bacterium]|nr:alkaline phosphatase family protein [Candidatus Acidoferrales bacterium]
MNWKSFKCLAAALLATILAVAAPSGLAAQREDDKDRDDSRTERPIKHLVVIFQENVSFDHYFGTYPRAANPQGEPEFHARPGTPEVNGLNDGLLNHNPNSTQPFRLDRSQNRTCDMNHDYTPEQQAFNKGLMDKFVELLGTACTDANEVALGKGIVMGYYDGNTVTALWNYAQRFAMNDNSYNTVFGPSTPGAINLISGQTHGVDPATVIGNISEDVAGNSVIGDPDPTFDDCGSPEQLGMLHTNKNVGDLLNAKGVTWGWFEGGFTPSSVVNGKAVCNSKTTRLDGTQVRAYSAHHEPFQYYPQTANPHHLPPTSTAMIGHTDQANHQYDLTDFWKAAFA